MTSSRAEKDNTDDKSETKTAGVAARGSADAPSPGQDDEDDDEASRVASSILSIYLRCVFPRPRLPTNCLMRQSPWVSHRPYVGDSRTGTKSPGERRGRAESTGRDDKTHEMFRFRRGDMPVGLALSRHPVHPLLAELGQPFGLASARQTGEAGLATVRLARARHAAGALREDLAPLGGRKVEVHGVAVVVIRVGLRVGLAAALPSPTAGRLLRPDPCRGVACLEAQRVQMALHLRELPCRNLARHDRTVLE